MKCNMQYHVITKYNTFHSLELDQLLKHLIAVHLTEQFEILDTMSMRYVQPSS